jgi:pilus assembly protein CpaC
VDAVAVTSREVLLNAKASGVTSLIVWSKPGERQMFTVYVSLNADVLDRQMRDSFPGEPIQIRAGKDAITLTGRVSSPAVSERAAALAATAAKTVINNLDIAPPPSEKQIILRVRFAEVNRVALMQFGVNILSTGALNTPGSLSTQQYSPPRAPSVTSTIGAQVTGTTTSFSLADVLNVFAFRPDLNVAALIRALQSNNMLEILAEPNLITTNGKEAIFLAGGEFPFPVVQGGGNAGAVTIQFREFGVRVSFTPVLTPHNTVKMHVRPEVSSLDFSNALVISGFTVPAIATRRVDADVELQAGQSFAIAGLLDRRITENLQKIPGLASIPLLGNLFKSRNTNKADLELLVVVTPEIAGPEVKVEPSAIALSERLTAPPPDRKQ